MSGENATETAWQEWLRTATYASLSEHELLRAQYVEKHGEDSQHAQMLSERTQILAEMDKRVRAAADSKRAMFPRVTFSELEDAELMGVILKEFALNVVEKLSHLRSLQNLADAAAAVGVPAMLVIESENGRVDVESLRRESVGILLRTADLLKATGAQLVELRERSGKSSPDQRVDDMEIGEMSEVIAAAVDRYTAKGK